MQGLVARVALDPGRRVPVIDEAALGRLSRSLDEAEASGARALIISGGRSGTFAAGADLAALARLDPGEASDFARAGQSLFDRLGRFRGVTIAAVRGLCIGGAFDLAMSCDLRLAEQGATFRHPGPRLGFITGYGGTSRLPLLAGPAAAAVLTGWRDLDAAAALSIGLVCAVTGAGQVEAAALAIAERAAGVEPARVRLIKEALARLPGAAAPLRLERRMAELARAAADAGR